MAWLNLQHGRIHGCRGDTRHATLFREHFQNGPAQSPEGQYLCTTKKTISLSTSAPAGSNSKLPDGVPPALLGFDGNAHPGLTELDIEDLIGIAREFRATSLLIRKGGIGAPGNRPRRQ